MELHEIAAAVNGVLSPPDTTCVEVNRITSLENADPQSLSFIVKQSYTTLAQQSSAAAIFIKEGWEIEGKTTITVADPYVAYALAAQLFEDTTPRFGKGVSRYATLDTTCMLGRKVSIGPGAIIGKDVTIGDKSVIDANAVIEAGTTIGDNCHIQSNAVICKNSVIHNNVIVGPGAIIGSEGFANAFTGKSFIRIPCFGRVILEDNVEVGANTTIDRGNFEDTIIKQGARIDNLVQIAHNVTIGESCGIAAQVGFAGSTKVGNRVMVGGQAGFGGHITIGDDVFVGGQSGVQSDIESKATLSGSPALDLMQRRRIDAAETKLPQALKEIKRLRKELTQLASKER